MKASQDCVEQVVADQHAAGAEDPAGFGQGVFPGDGVVREPAEDEIERLVRIGQGADVGSERGRSITEAT